nr:glutaredoxin [Candidatus Njordarchaeum guaymaensis]
MVTDKVMKMFVETNCPSCKALKSFLNSKNVKYVELNIDNPEHKVDALMLNIYTVPALMIGDKVLRASEMFDSSNSLKRDQVLKFIGKD